MIRRSITLLSLISILNGCASIDSKTKENYIANRQLPHQLTVKFIPFGECPPDGVMKVTGKVYVDLPFSFNIKDNAGNNCSATGVLKDLKNGTFAIQDFNYTEDWINRHWSDGRIGDPWKIPLEKWHEAPGPFPKIAVYLEKF